MSSIVKYACEELAGATVDCIVKDGELWVDSNGVATILGYASVQKARRCHVDEEDQIKLEELGLPDLDTLDRNARNKIFINESGLLSLILRSNMDQAKVFKRWVTKEVLPRIRKTGSYSAPLLGKQIKLLNETDLHYKVIDCIRNKFVEMVAVPGLGEMQATKKQRIDGWRKGYRGGQPDVLVLNKTAK